VVTSRAALRIEGEREFPLHPLALPSSQSDIGEIVASPAVELFVARARAVRPGLALSGEDAVQVVTICRRLDGLPLAIELAAARVKVLTLVALGSRLENSLGVLGTGRRDASDRQRTLQGAIAWSYELLDGDEQRLFARLGVFAGGWSLEAAEAVCDRGDALDVLDGIASLVNELKTGMADPKRDLRDLPYGSNTRARGCDEGRGKVRQSAVVLHMPLIA
jgi:predicted ATPase